RNPADAGTASPLRVGRVSLHVPLPRITLSGEGASDAGAVRCRLDAGPVRAEAPGVDLRVKAVTLDGDIRFEGAEEVRGTLKLAGEEATLTAGPAKSRTSARLPSLALSGDAIFSRKGGLRFDGKADLAGAAVTVPGSRTSVEDIRLSLPLTWPWGASEAAGSLSFSALRWDRQDMGALKGRLHPRPDGLRFDGDFAARLLPGLVLKLSGESPFLAPEKPSGLAWSARYRPATPLDLGRFAKTAKGMTVEGTLSVDGRMDFGGGIAPGGGMTASLAGGRITAKARDMRMEDIRLDLHFPALPTLRSAPDQRLAVGKATLGKIRIEDVGLRFQIEPDTAVLIEKGRFTWCGGTVSTQSLRIAPDMADVELILYCDRLNLARLLDQLGAARAEGRGAVNGRLPIRLRNGTVRFDDGFLYSTPGDGGVIHVTEARVLTAGIPENTPQFAQIDLAVEALKSYEYAWAKLGITTEGENLRLNLQFDGKPTAPLPFVYQKEFGGFVRVAADHPGSVFQGIRLDVNLGLPLDKILRYRGLMDNIQ
uniref:intermembrane phospholipid transport protein YdbH family protein n=1 Tax=Desulfococcus sp. TaxID=2025834 RepID=UPI0035932BF8